MAAYAPPTKATAAIPYAYRFALTTLEPLIALGGIHQALSAPQDYLSIMTRSSVTYDPATQFLYTELAGAWLFLVFLEVLALRQLDDLRVWRWICTGGLLQDALYAWSVAQAVGGWDVWLDVAGWGAMDWLVFCSTAPSLIARLLIVLGVGVGVKQEKWRKA
ncbi:uncharacterized protein DNG_04906 [Cephalotrichum gorgonifer]|uniref:DUF7704 domain-containing protein n=1 Tax=Cephalotrichum gorgonifer TaxID=2041049 RepID=A0AAE8SV07_9PEZI|nr:uncharacterized protein DNG_04906 [Cephalotrichum gorgonifer]